MDTSNYFLRGQSDHSVVVGRLVLGMLGAPEAGILEDVFQYTGLRGGPLPGMNRMIRHHTDHG